jgi:D-beta-D-heptose 7-phosphate kinase/D-beta-D-heptose 1-phosphate adenosyltransferase
MSIKDIKTGEDITVLGRKILKTLNFDSVLITRGEKGMILVQTGNRVKNIPARAKEVYNATVTGDAVISVTALHCIGCEGGFDKCAKGANFAAGIVVDKAGTGTINLCELEKTIKNAYKK